MRRVGLPASPVPAVGSGGRFKRRLLLAYLQSPLLKTSRSNVIVFVPFRHDTTTLCEFLQSYHVDVGGFLCFSSVCSLSRWSGYGRAREVSAHVPAVRREEGVSRSHRRDLGLRSGREPAFGESDFSRRVKPSPSSTCSASAPSKNTSSRSDAIVRAMRQLSAQPFSPTSPSRSSTPPASSPQ